MAEGQVLIKDLPEATTVADSSYIPVDNGTLTKKISVENFNNSSNQTAKGYAEQAQAAATTATEAIADVNSKVDAAQAQANIATTQAGYAQTYAGNAQTYAGNAQGYANTAQGSATNAAASASAASSSADAANDNATLARSWAEGNTGARAGENTNNARYWANKAESAAQITIDPALDPSSTNPVENRAIYDAINAMHTGGSNITITTTETSLRGKDCVLTDGTTSYTETFDLTGKALFEGVQLTGAITITSTDGTQTATDTLNVPYFGNFSKSIAFWRATIAVTTTTTQFNGLNVVAKKNGAVMGTGTFSSGSASLTVPSAGTYVLEVTLDWKTYTSSPFSVTEETTYNETIDGYIAPISLTTPTSEFYGQSISVTRNGVALPVSLAFDSTGAATFTALDSGSYVFTLTYGGEPYTATVTVEAATTYSAVIKMWTATVNISTTSSVLQLQQIVVKKSGVQVGITQFNAAGTASYLAHEAGTYTFECTYDSYPFSSDPVAVSEETTYSTTITAFTATLNISTTSAELYSRPITIKKGSTTVGTTAFSSSGSATYRVHETGTYTLTCDGYDSSVTVTTETTYPVSILAGLDLASWISAGSTTEHPLNPSSYADFSALEADEEAIRQLMTVHASVDYLAQATAGDSLTESVIGSDVCAKWINLRDYALDTLYANSDIADVMDSADKYFYGEWVYDGTSWGAKGNVPIMTANNAPYGTVLESGHYSTRAAYQLFDGTTNGWVQKVTAANYVGYVFVNPVNVKKLVLTLPAATAEYRYYNCPFTVEASNDGFASDIRQIATGTIPDFNASITLLVVDISDDSYNMAYRLYFPSTSKMYAVSGEFFIYLPELQFYGRELKPYIPPMTTDTTPYGRVTYSRQASDYPAVNAFNGDASKQWIPAYGSSGNVNDCIGYGAVSPINVRSILIVSNARFPAFSFEGSDDNNTYNPIDTLSVTSSTMLFNINNDDYYTYHRIRATQQSTSTNPSIFTLQFFGFDYSEKEFTQDSNRLTIYDHGIELVEMEELSTANGWTPSSGYTFATNGFDKLSDSLYIHNASNNKFAGGGTKTAVTFGSYDLMGVIGIPTSSDGYSVNIAIFSGKNLANAIGNITITTGQREVYLDVQSYSGNYDISTLASNNASRYGYIEELWLE